MTDIDPRVFDQMNASLQKIASAVAGKNPWGSTPNPKTPQGNPNSTIGGSATHVFKKVASQGHAAFAGAVKKTTDSVKLMHGGVDDLAYSLRGLARIIPSFLIIGGVFEALIGGTQNLIATYRKMTAVGDMFGGSMFAMAAAAGQSGLSLNEFSQFMIKHSETEGVLNRLQGASANSLTQLQLSVRKNLAPLGMFGMSLDDLINTSADFEEILLKNGVAARLTSNEQNDMVTKMIKDVNLFSAVAHKNRDEIAKTMGEAMKRVAGLQDFALRNTGKTGIESNNQITAFLATFMPQMTSYFAETVGLEGKAYFTQMGEELTNLGLGRINDINGAMAQKVINNQSVSVDDQIDLMKQTRDILGANRASLVSQYELTKNPHILELLNQYTTLNNQLKDEKTIRAALNAELKKQQQAEVTKSFTNKLLTLESEYSMVTGSFLEGFYKQLENILDSLFPKDMLNSESDRFKKFLDSMKFFGDKVGIITGWIVNVVMKVLGFAGGKFEDLVNAFTEWVGSINKDDVEAAIKSFVDTIKSAWEKLKEFITKIGEIIDTIYGWTHPFAKSKEEEELTIKPGDSKELIERKKKVSEAREKAQELSIRNGGVSLPESVLPHLWDKEFDPPKKPETPTNDQPTEPTTPAQPVTPTTPPTSLPMTEPDSHMKSSAVTDAAKTIADATTQEQINIRTALNGDPTNPSDPISLLIGHLSDLNDKISKQNDILIYQASLQKDNNDLTEKTTKAVQNVPASS